MHTLFAFPYSCSLAVHCSLERYDVPFEIRWVKRGPGRKVADSALAAVNPKRKVPTLVQPNGEVLTEIVVVLDHLDANGPARDAATHRASLEALCFLSSELHQQVLGPVFDPATPAVVQEDARLRLLPPVLEHIESLLGRQRFVNGDEPSGADAYLLWSLLLLQHRWPELVSGESARFVAEMLALPWVRRAVGRERAAFAAVSGT